MARPARVLPPGYQPYTDEQRRLRTAYAGGVRTDEARDAVADYRAWQRRFPNVPTPKLAPLPVSGKAETVTVDYDETAPAFEHGTPEGARLGCKSSNCANQGSLDRMTCEQALIRYRGDYAFRKAVDAGTATTYKAGHEPAEAAVATPAPLAPRPAKPKTTAPAPTPALSEDELGTLPVDERVERFRPEPVDRVAEAIGEPHFELDAPPIDDAPLATAAPSVAEQLDQARLELLECERANRYQQAELRSRIRELEDTTEQRREAIAETVSRQSALEEQLEAKEHQIRGLMADLALADETNRQQELALERMVRDHAAYTALAAVPPQLGEGITLRAFIVEPTTPLEKRTMRRFRAAARAARSTR